MVYSKLPDNAKPLFHSDQVLVHAIFGISTFTVRTQYCTKYVLEKETVWTTVQWKLFLGRLKVEMFYGEKI